MSTNQITHCPTNHATARVWVECSPTLAHWGIVEVSTNAPPKTNIIHIDFTFDHTPNASTKLRSFTPLITRPCAFTPHMQPVTAIYGHLCRCRPDARRRKKGSSTMRPSLSVTHPKLHTRPGHWPRRADPFGGGDGDGDGAVAKVAGRLSQYKAWHSTRVKMA